MKVLFVGEGRHDIGRATFDKSLRDADGVVPTLCRMISPCTAAGSVAIQWSGIATLSQKKLKTGYGPLRSELRILEKNCPLGFTPFANDVRTRFPSPASSE